MEEMERTRRGGMTVEAVADVSGVSVIAAAMVNETEYETDKMVSI